MKIEVLLSTMNCQDINDLKLNKGNMINNMLVVNQTNNENKLVFDTIRMFNFSEKGLSKSRNRAIDNSSGDICLIADDDIVYKENIESIIVECFEKNPDADIITFQIETPENGFFKKYSTKEFWHNKRSILRVSSIEVAFKRSSILDSQVRFDELFGLGSKYISGEENIFLMDCLKKGLKIKYIPIPIVIHPYENSRKNYSVQQFISKGALFYRLFGRKAFILSIIFAIKKYPEYRRKYKIINAIKLMNRGICEYMKLEREF